MATVGDGRVYCRHCRTFTAPRERCGTCFRRRVTTDEDDELELAAARSLSEARVVHATSRLRAGTTTFGPVGRIGWSIVPVLSIGFTIVLAYRFRAGPAIAFFLVAAIATTVTMLGILRIVWRRERVD